MSEFTLTYRGIEIRHTSDVVGFNVSARDKFCFTVQYRSDDDGPILTMCPTVEDCRLEIDEYFEDEGHPV